MAAPAEDRPVVGWTEDARKRVPELNDDGLLRPLEVGPQGQITAKPQVGAQPVSQHLSQLGVTLFSVTLPASAGQ